MVQAEAKAEVNVDLKSVISYRVWQLKKNQYYTDKEHTTSSIDVATAKMKELSGKGKYVFITFSWKLGNLPKEVYFLVNSLDNKVSRTDYRHAVMAFIRRRAQTRYGTV